MLVVDPRERATLHEIMNHPWMTKGFNTAPENFMTQREPLQLPLDEKVIEKMQGFDFGPAQYISDQLTNILSSDDYQAAVRRYYRDEPAVAPSGDKKRGVFDFYRRRNSISREGLTTPSTEAIRGLDPINGYSPLISIYYLAREKLEQERRVANPGALGIATTAPETSTGPAPLASPEAAYTNAFSPEIPGEKATGGRSRPRARTNGEDESKAAEQTVPATRPPPSSFQAPSDTQPKKEGTAMGLLRRFSTRRVRNPDERPQPPTLNIQPPQDSATAPRKSFSVRRSRRREPSPSTATHHAGGSQPQHEGLLSAGTSKARNFLGRSTSVNSADYRPRRLLHRGGSEADSPNLNADPPATSGSDRSTSSQRRQKSTDPPGEPASEQSAEKTPPIASSSTPRAPNAARTKSLGHARQESIQARRRKWEESRRDRHANVPEETDAELRDEAGGPDTPAMPDTPSAEVAKPAGLKGLFSTSTTSSKPPEFIRQDLIRVLKQLGVEYTVIRGGFTCRHAPSINLDDVKEPADEEKSGRVAGGHQRRISFGGAFRGKDREDIRDEKAHRRRRHPDQSFVTNSEGSEEYLHQRREESGRDAGATTTRVQDDTGERMVLRWEISIVKIPLLSLHGIRFQKISGAMNQYRSMTGKILQSLRL
jgi:serine/threonine protein kinase KIN1/2